LRIKETESVAGRVLENKPKVRPCHNFYWAKLLASGNFVVPSLSICICVSVSVSLPATPPAPSVDFDCRL